MGVRTPETCQAVNKRQVIDWRNCSIPLVDLFETYVTLVICSLLTRVFRLRRMGSLKHYKFLPQLIQFHIKLLNDFPHIQFVANIECQHYVFSSYVLMSMAVFTKDQRYRPLLVNTWKSVAGNNITFWLQCNQFPHVYFIQYETRSWCTWNIQHE